MSSMISEEDQERYLDKGLKAVKAQSYHIHNTIEKNNLRQCLKETFSMLCELRTNHLTPRNYYQLFTVVFDEMMLVENFMKDEISRGRRVKDLYDSVQQAQFIIPRLYLMITAGSVYVENKPESCREIIFDLLSMVKGVQNPIRGLFTRYYLLKMIKNKLPDKDNDYLKKEGGTFEDTLKFIIQNMEEMNRLWIRLSTGVLGNEKLLREKERNELKVLVGESIIRLSSLDGLTIDLYETQVLPKLLEIIVESKDQLSQQYLMECIIQAFPDDYNIKCMKSILDTFAKLTQGVDIKSLFIGLMDKLSKYVGDDGVVENEHKSILEESQKIYGLLNEHFDTLIKEGLKDGINMEVNKLLDLEVSFMKYSLKCSPENEKLNSANHILSSALKLLDSFGQKLSLESNKKLCKILSIPLENNLSLFSFIDFPNLMSYLDFASRKNLSLKIIVSLVNGTCKENVDSVEKVQKLLQYIKPLIADFSDSVECDDYTFEYEQTTVCKLIFIINNKNPEILYQIYNELKNVFINSGERRKKFILPALTNCIILFCHKISLAYDNKNGLVPEDMKTNKIKDLIDSVDISAIDSGETLFKELLQNYKLINETITSLCEINTETALNLYLLAANQVNSIQSDRASFEEACASFINAALNIFQTGKYPPEKKNIFLLNITNALFDIKMLRQEALIEILNTLTNSITSLNKRNEQCSSMLALSNIYYSQLKDYKKVKECIKKATKFVDYSMSNPINLILYVNVLNKIIYFIDDAEDNIFNGENLEDILEVIKNHIQTMKTETNNDISFLPPIEEYFQRTVDLLKKRKEENKKQAYIEVTL